MAADAATRVAPTPSVAQALRSGRIAALRRRMDAVDDAVRAALEQRIAALEASPAGEPRHCMRRGAIDDDRATGQAAPGHVAAPSARTSLFAPLLATLEQEARWRDAHAVDGLPARAAYPALPALQPLRALWARLRIEGQTREALAPALDWLLKSNLAALFSRVPRLAELIFYNRDAAILSAEDPQLEFYLSNLNWPALARDSGHPTLDWDPERGFAVGSTAVVTVVEPALSPALNRVLLPRSRVLHLSDLHFDTQEHAIQWYDQLHGDLRGELGYDSLDAVILSGDISNHAIPSEFDAASQCMRDLQADFKLTPSQFVLVPGNHDVSWTRSKQAYKVWRREDYKEPLSAGQFIDKGEYIEVPDDTNHRARFQPFADFYYAVRLEPYPLDYEYQATVHHFADKKLLVLGLNSAWQLDHHFRDRADIHGVALGRALRRIQQEPSYADCLKLAVWHHPLQSPDPDRLRDTGFVERLAQAGFRLALHGHIHKPQQGLFRYDMAASGRRIDFLGAGTCGAPTREWQPGYPLQYQLLEFHGHRLTVRSRKREELNGSWKPDARWTQGPDQHPLAHYEIDL